MSIIDLRVIKQAEILVDYSLKLKKGENVIVFFESEAKPLVLEVYKLLVKRGANEIRLRLSDYEFSEIYLNNASARQIKAFPQVEMDEIKSMDCYIRIGAPANTRGLSNVDANKISVRSKITKPIQDYRVQKTRWVVTRYPTNSQAQEADMSLSEYSNFVLNAITGVDWRNKEKEQEKLKKLMDATDEVHILAEKTDLRFSIRSRNAINAFGTHNMPDGEVFTSVIEDSTNGFITFTYPALQLGKEFHDVRLEFKNGSVTKAIASKGEGDLNGILDTDKGSKIIGEFGVGNNFQIDRFTKDGLFDEKIGGTIHLALGFGYLETKSKNVSALHWDMIKDLRQEGELWFDDKLVQKNGKWLIRM